MDIDGFARVNDSFDHRTGDYVLRMVARTAENSLRKQDTISRWSGDEFLIVVPNVSEGAIAMVAERVRILVEKSFLIMDGREVAVTASVGATMARTDDRLDTLVHRADELITKSKQGGGNKVTTG